MFGIPAARLGLGYVFGDLNLLVQLVGPSNAKEILYTAKRFDAEQAMAMGLLNRVVEDGDLDSFVDDHRPYAAVDIDRDGFPEFIGRGKIMYKDGRKWRTFELKIPYMDCPC